MTTEMEEVLKNAKDALQSNCSNTAFKEALKLLEAADTPTPNDFQTISSMLINVLEIIGSVESLHTFLTPVISSIQQNVLKQIDFLSANLKKVSPDKTISLLDNVSMLLKLCSMIVLHLHCKKTVTTDFVWIQEIFNIMQITYEHCSKFENIYTKSVSEPVQVSSTTLFSECQSLQKSILMLLANSNVTAKTERNLEAIVKICDALCDLFILQIRMGSRETFSYLKIYIVLVEKNTETLRTRLNAEKMLNLLSEETAKDLNELKTAPILVSFQKLIKISHFKLKMIAFLCETFKGFLEGCIANLTKLLLVMYQKVPVNVAIPADRKKILEDNILVAIDPLVTHLLSERAFNTHAFAQYDSQHFSHCLLVLDIIVGVSKSDDEIWNLWMGCESVLLSKFFSLYSECALQQCLPVFFVNNVSIDGQAVKTVTFYHYVFTRLCCFVACTPQNYFNVLEKELFKALLLYNGSQSCLVVDVWCFLARYALPNLCLEYCFLLAKVLINRENLQQVKQLLRRMFKFLPSNHQLTFIQQYPPTNYPFLWVVIPSTVITRSNVTNMCNAIYQKLSQNRSLRDKLFFYEMLINHSDLELSSSSMVIQELLKLYALIPMQFSRCQLTEWILTMLARQFSTKSFIITSKNLDIAAKLIMKLPSLCHLSQGAQLLGLVILRKLVNVSLPGNIHTSISNMFTSLLASPHFLIKGLALETFSSFAHFTPQKELIPRICSGKLVSMITKHLNKVSELSVQNRELLLVRLISLNPDSNSFDLDLAQPRKKTKYDEKCLSDALQTIRSSVEVLKNAWGNKELSDSNISEIKHLKFCLEQLIS